MSTSRNTNSTHFTARDFANLQQNENYRYLPNGMKIGHAVIYKQQDGIYADQYLLPNQNATTQWYPLKNIRQMDRFGQVVYKAETDEPVSTAMYGKRYLEFKANGSSLPENETMQMVCFSPTHDDKEPFWGSNKPIALFNNSLDEHEQADLNAESKDIKEIIKGGEPLVIEAESVRYRDANKTRTPNQNNVMTESAVKAYEGFLEMYRDNLSQEFITKLDECIKAPLHNVFHSQKRPEWLHAYGFSLTPIDQNPQRRDNLGAAPKWSNTEMMVTERLAKWFAINEPDLYVAIKPRFEMLLDSDLIKRIEFEVNVENQNEHKSITFIQNIDPFKKNPLYRKATDLAQGTGIADSLLHGVKPHRTEKISHIARRAATVIQPNPIVVPNTTNVMPEAPRPILQPAAVAPHPVVVAPKTTLPTHLKHANSIVKVKVRSYEPQYDTPWMGSEVQSCSGTGFIIEYAGKKYVLTNAHCVENALLMRIRFANQTKHYEATVKQVSYQCDLALLEVNDDEFNQKAVPLDLGNMVSLEDEVFALGFPVGGDEISISRGIVSRIEVRGYSMSGLDMLQVQVDAAINPGNSGGPVLSADRVVGVAFQGYSLRAGLNYMIPIPIIQHFLQEAFSNKPYRGFPELPIKVQHLRNDYQKEYYGLRPNESGLRIKQIFGLSDASKKLKVDDIVLEIDSLPISSGGTVDVPGIGNNIDYLHVMHMKYIDDSIRVKVMRKNVNGSYERFNLNITLDTIPNDEHVVKSEQHDVRPVYYIASGISFTPLTANYIHGKGSEFDEMHMVENGGLLTELYKKSKDQELVVINEVIDCLENDGYGDCENEIVKEVNGVVINNLLDVIKAIEQNNNNFHYIKVGSGNIMVVKNMPKPEHDALLKKWHIKQDCSDDLLAFRNSLQNQVDEDDQIQLVHEKKDNEKVNEKEMEKVTAATIDSDEENNDATKENKKVREKEKIDIDDQSDDSTDEVSNVLSGQVMPGVRRYADMVNALEQNYKNLTDDDLLDDENDEDFDNSQSHESDDEALESDEESIEKNNDNSNKFLPSSKRNNAKQSCNSSRFFNKRKRDDDDSLDDLPKQNQKKPKHR